MNSDADNIEYARTQLEEAHRRLESVRDRTTEIKKRQIVGAFHEDTDELLVGEAMKHIPEERREPVVVKEEDTEVTNVEGHIQNIIIDCQMSIELSVKSMFKAVGQDFDYKHGIEFKSHNTKGFNSKVPADFPRGEDIIRSIFLTQLWEKFYELAKYGAPELDVGPSVLFDINDGEKAITDATFCVNLAEEFIDYVDE